MNYILFVLVVLILIVIYSFYSENYDNSLNKNNILGTNLEICCNDPGKVTGYYRDGICSTGSTDQGTHVVCAIMDDDFLQYTSSQGNDLITPHPPSFPGLVAGDKWCVCILRWIQAYNAGKAPKLIPESTNEFASTYISKDILLEYSN
jgi:hypothetical protein